ncbi:MAG: hypothetical protein IT381_32315 [Deltaproteobacteria bacterium]|nr:hypothetical protein [Deltaproteobacteria bacterium]
MRVIEEPMGVMLAMAAGDSAPSRAPLETITASDWHRLWIDLEKLFELGVHTTSSLGIGGSWVKGNFFQILARVSANRGSLGQTAIEGTRTFLRSSKSGVTAAAMESLVCDCDTMCYRQYAHAETAIALLRGLLFAATQDLALRTDIANAVQSAVGVGREPAGPPLHPSANEMLRDATIDENERIRRALDGVSSPRHIRALFPPAAGRQYGSEEARDTLVRVRAAFNDDRVLASRLEALGLRAKGSVRWLLSEWLRLLVEPAQPGRVRVRQVTSKEMAEVLCSTGVDRVPGDMATTAFKRAARVHQARWRQARGFPVGTLEVPHHPPRPFGCRLPLAFAKATGANFVDARSADAARARVSAPQHHQMLDEERLFSDLLSSMPMCFNLFGTIAEPELATRALKSWFPDVPGRVERVIFEWSPARNDQSYLGNRTAFDVAFILDLGGNQRGVLAIETKYHEHPIRVGIKPRSVPRYLEVSRRSGLFDGVDLDSLVHDVASQLWLDHLLALSMLQHPSRQWTWVRFVVVYADGNPSWERLIARYRSMLSDASTFASCTIDDLIDAPVLEPAVRAALIERYRCWERR